MQLVSNRFSIQISWSQIALHLLLWMALRWVGLNFFGIALCQLACRLSSTWWPARLVWTWFWATDAAGTDESAHIDPWWHEIDQDHVNRIGGNFRQDMVARAIPFSVTDSTYTHLYNYQLIPVLEQDPFRLPRKVRRELLWKLLTTRRSSHLCLLTHGHQHRLVRIGWTWVQRDLYCTADSLTFLWRKPRPRSPVPVRRVQALRTSKKN
jgi:hypothetical protein